MPRYEYRCETNGELVEVSHTMSERLTTWGEVCQRAGIEPGKTPADTPVEKVISVGFVKGSAGGGLPPGSCGHGCGCHPN